MAIVNYSSKKLGTFSYDDTEYDVINKQIRYIGKSNKPTYLEGLINYSYMFYYRSDLSYLDLSDWDTSNVIKLKGMFLLCTNLKEIKGLENWNVSSVKNMRSMFCDCYKLKEIKGLENWNVSNVKKICNMFNDCRSLEDISALKDWDTSNVAHAKFVFANCKKILDASCLNNWNCDKISKIEDPQYMFLYCNSDIILPNWYIEYIELDKQY